jgi:hypothetical protein
VDVTHLDLTLAEEVVYGVACVVLPSGVRKVTPHRSLHNSIHQPDSVANRD